LDDQKMRADLSLNPDGSPVALARHPLAAISLVR
jgi:hypothetical protein